MITLERNDKKWLEKCVIGVWDKKYIVFYCKRLFYSFIVLLTQVKNKNISKDIFFLIKVKLLINVSIVN